MSTKRNANRRPLDKRQRRTRFWKRVILAAIPALGVIIAAVAKTPVKPDLNADASVPAQFVDVADENVSERLEDHGRVPPEAAKWNAVFDWVVYVITLEFPVDILKEAVIHICFDSVIRNVSNEELLWRPRIRGFIDPLEVQMYVYEPEGEPQRQPIEWIKQDGVIVGWQSAIAHRIPPGGTLRWRTYGKYRIIDPCISN